MITIQDLIDQYCVVVINSRQELNRFLAEIVEYKPMQVFHYPIKIDMNRLAIYDESYYTDDLPTNNIPQPFEIEFSKIMDTLPSCEHQLESAAHNLDKALNTIKSICRESVAIEKEMD